MPTYIFLCPLCDYIHETRSRKYEDPVILCPRCLEETGDETEMERVISAANLSFIGEGFYVNDHKKFRPQKDEDDED